MVANTVKMLVWKDENTELPLMCTRCYDRLLDDIFGLAPKKTSWPPPEKIVKQAVRMDNDIT